MTINQKCNVIFHGVATEFHQAMTLMVIMKRNCNVYRTLSFIKLRITHTNAFLCPPCQQQIHLMCYDIFFWFHTWLSWLDWQIKLYPCTYDSQRVHQLFYFIQTAHPRYASFYCTNNYFLPLTVAVCFHFLYFHKIHVYSIFVASMLLKEWIGMKPAFSFQQKLNRKLFITWWRVCFH